MARRSAVDPTGPPRRPGFWFRMSVAAGILIQLAGILLGILLLYLGSRLSPQRRGLKTADMLLSFLLVNTCCHAIAHWAVGRLVGIRFRGYGVRGTDHPEDYPPGLRQAMRALPTFTALTQRDSLRRASPRARAAMFAAGETSTAICCILMALAAWRLGFPFGRDFFYAVVVFNVISTIVTPIVPRGDYAKARRALRSASERTPS